VSAGVCCGRKCQTKFIEKDVDIEKAKKIVEGLKA